MQVGVIYGNATSTGFDVAVTSTLKRLDYVEVRQENHRVLGQVGDIERKSKVGFEEALAGGTAEDQLSARIHVIGYVDSRGLVQTPRNPFRAGDEVLAADEALVTSVLGLAGADRGAYIGHVKGSRIPVRLGLNMLAQKHVSVLAKTGAGKSYTVGVILEEFLAAGVPLVILDPHGEYGSLSRANVEEGELEAMSRFGVRPKSYQKQIVEYALDTFLNPEAEKLRLEGLNLEGHEIADLLGGRLSGGQMGVLYQAVKDVKEHNPAYTLRDVMDGVNMNKSSAKWNVLNALEALDSTGVFGTRGTPASELVQPGRCTILNLKGVAPDVQDIAVTRIANMLWQARKRNEVPPHILVVEEAHNFCPERGIGNAISGPVLRTVASEGRKFGMGLVIVSQRPAKIDKNVLSQCNTQVVLKVTNPNDLKAITQSVEGITSDAADEIQRLPIGVALVAGGGLTQPVFVDVRPRQTRHGGRSIEVVGNDDSEDDPDDSEPLEEPFEEPPAPVDVFDEPVEPRRTPPPAVDVPVDAPHAPSQELDDLPVFGEPDDVPEPEPVVAPPVPTNWSKADKAHIQRVAGRVGIVGSTDANATMEFLRRLAAQAGHDADEQFLLFREVGEHVCRETLPACIRCPLGKTCQHHAALKQERKKQKKGVRKLWMR